MYIHRIFLGTVVAMGVVVMALPASAAGLFGLHNHGTWFGDPVFAGSGYHSKGHRHHHGRRGHWRHDGHRHDHRRRPGKGRRTLHTMEHRHDGLGWHVHREWRRHGHPKPRRHGHRRNDDWEEGAGIALGVLAGMLFLNQFADGSNATGFSGHTGGQSRNLDIHSQQRQSQAIRRALDAGGNSAVTWTNPANWSGSASGKVRITRNGRDEYGNPCREYHQTLRVGNRTEQGYRVACRDRNGNWHLQ